MTLLERNQKMQTENWKIRVAILCLCVGVASACLGKVIYVDADAPAANNGSSWTDAYRYLRDALADANALGKPVEIRVTQGIYRPDEDALHPDGTGDREATFQLINGVTLKGGYAGPGQPDPNVRDTGLYETILSGDLNGDDGPNFTSNSENCYHVLSADMLSPNAVLDGFTITAGNADGVYPNPNDSGGGICNSYGSPTINNCTFRGNFARDQGGGMSNKYGSPILYNCTFTENSSFSGGGGGMSNLYGSPVLTGCVFIGNSSDHGGGMYSDNVFGCDGDCPILVDCTFKGNYADWVGGGMDSNYDSLMLVNSTFIGNSAGFVGYGTGGGAISANQTIATLINCTFSGNSADSYGGAIIFGEIPYATSRMINCILWGNDADEGPQIALYWASLSVSYCDIQGGQANIALLTCCDELAWGAGNIDSDPCFVEVGHWDNDVWVDGDYHLKSQGGRWDADEERWTIDDITSLCIDAGDPMSPIGHEPFPNGGTVNMGAYGGTAEASKSYFNKPPCETIVSGDINGDCEVNFEDFRLLALHWLEEH